MYCVPRSLLLVPEQLWLLCSGHLPVGGTQPLHALASCVCDPKPEIPQGIHGVMQRSVDSQAQMCPGS